MDFLVCKCGIQGLELHIPLENIDDQTEAASKAKSMAMETKEGATIGLFTQEGNAICGWTVLSQGRLRDESPESIQYKCGVSPRSFDFAKKQAEKLRALNGHKQK